MKVLAIVLFTFFLCPAVMAQQVGKDNRTITQQPGAVYGWIAIKEVSGNNVGNFLCTNLTVQATKLEGAWHRTAKPTGNFSSRRCSFLISNVPAGETFVVALTAQFPNSCDEKKFETTTSFPMKLKPREQLKYDFIVSRIRCVLAK